MGGDEFDPSGYQLGLGLSVASAVESSTAETSEGAPESEPTQKPSVGYAAAQMGWWNAELEFLTLPGLYFAAGVPWAVAVVGHIEDSVSIPFGARVGYQLDASEEWKVRAAAHLIGWTDPNRNCEVGCSTQVASFQLFELGVRHVSPSGWVYGIDIPLLAIEDILGLDDRVNLDREILAPPLSLAFTQLYVGYAWGL